MENSIGDFFETGDYMIVFAGEYLGSGKTVISLESAWHEIRRDDFLLPQSKRLKGLHCKVVFELKSARKVWEVLSKLDPEIFISGAVLQLFPADSRKPGYEFQKVFFDSLIDNSGDTANAASARLAMRCEISADAPELFNCLPENARPENLPEKIFPDLKNLLRQIGMLLSEQLDAVFDHTLHIGYMPTGRSCYNLELAKCKAWNSAACRLLELKLTARFPLQEKFSVDEKLYKTANFLQGFIIEHDENTALHCQIGELDFTGSCTVAGKTFTSSVMHFTLALL